MPEYLRFGQLRAAGVPFSRGKVAALVSEGAFPAPVAYGHQRAWLRDEVTAWATKFRAARSPV